MNLIFKRLSDDNYDDKYVVWNEDNGDFLVDVTMEIVRKRNISRGGIDHYFFRLHKGEKEYLVELSEMPAPAPDRNKALERVLNPPCLEGLYEFGTVLDVSPNVRHVDWYSEEADEIYSYLFPFLFKRFGAEKKKVTIKYIDHRTQERHSVSSDKLVKRGG